MTPRAPAILRAPPRVLPVHSLPIGRERFPRFQREVLTAARTYTVGATGNFATIQLAVDFVSANLDINGFTLTLNVQDATYTGTVVLRNVIGYRSSGDLIIAGNSGTPANVVISTTSANCFTADGLSVVWRIKDMKLQTTTSGDCLRAKNRSGLEFSNLNFGTCAGSHIHAETGASILGNGNYAVSGSALIHWNADSNSIITTSGLTITYSNTPAFSAGNCVAQFGGIIYAHNMTFTNGATVTGQRYVSTQNGLLNTSGGGANYIPGNSAGATSLQGQYF